MSLSTWRTELETIALTLPDAIKNKTEKVIIDKLKGTLKVSLKLELVGAGASQAQINAIMAAYDKLVSQLQGKDGRNINSAKAAISNFINVNLLVFFAIASPPAFVDPGFFTAIAVSSAIASRTTINSGITPAI